GRVRLSARRRVDARADAEPLRAAPAGWRHRLVRLGLPAPPAQLLDRGHRVSVSVRWNSGFVLTGCSGAGARAGRPTSWHAVGARWGRKIAGRFDRPLQGGEELSARTRGQTARARRTRLPAAWHEVKVTACPSVTRAVLRRRAPPDHPGRCSAVLAEVDLVE